MKRIISSSIILLAIFLLAACSNEHNVAEDMYTHLEKSVELEETFKNAQSELVVLEQEELELYNEMIEINMNEIEKINEIADQAANIAEQRKDLIDQERDSIQASKEEFDRIEEYIDQLEEEPKEVAEKMVEMMNNRFQAFDDLYNSYIHSIEQDVALYELLKDEDLDKETLDQQVENVNESYRQVKDAQENFNHYTNDFNALKREFYERSGLEVNYVDEE